MRDGPVETITGKARRRQWSVEEKLRIVAKAEEPGARITEVAAHNDVCPSLLFTWRWEGRLGANQPPSFVPVRLIPAATENVVLSTRQADSTDKRPGGIEIRLAGGIHIHIERDRQLPLFRH